MLELPDVTVYVERLAARILGEPLRGIRVASPFLLRTVEPPIGAAAGKRVAGVRRLGKQIVIGLEVLQADLESFRASLGRENHTLKRALTSVHGRYRQPCPACGAPVQRIVHAENECNYCPGCQTGGKLLADRALSRLLRGDWPRTLEELEQRRAQARVRARPGGDAP